MAAGLVFALVGGTPVSGAAQASPYVPLQDPAYADLDALIARGLLRDALVGQRPYSRVSFARLVRQASAALEERPVAAPGARFGEAVARLAREFAQELAYLCDAGRDCPRPVSRIRAVGASTDLTLAASPDRPARTPWINAGWPADTMVSFIDASINPLLGNQLGRPLVDGVTMAGELAVDFQAGPHLAGLVRPRAWIDRRSGGGVAADARLMEGYAHGVWGNLSVDVGRAYRQHAQGRSAGVSMSDHAGAFDMIRVGGERAILLPWIFDRLGPTNASILIADLGPERDIPNAKLIALELGGRPARNLELNASLLNIQSGEGAPSLCAPRIEPCPPEWQLRLEDIFLWWFPPILDRHTEASDKIATVDGRVTFPGPGIEAWFEVASTDVSTGRWGETFGDEAVWSGGLRAVGLGSEGRSDVWVQFHRSGVRPHTHHQFTSGVTLNGRLIGDPVGPLTTAGRVGLDWTGALDRWSVSGSLERYRGDLFRQNGEAGFDFAWDLLEDRADEIRVRVLADWSRSDAERGLTTRVRAGVERVSRFGYTGPSRTNLLAQAEVRYAW